MNEDEFYQRLNEEKHKRQTSIILTLIVSVGLLMIVLFLILHSYISSLDSHLSQVYSVLNNVSICGG